MFLFTQGTRGGTALRKASTFGHLGVVETLLKNGARVDIRDNEGKTPLMWAVFFRRYFVVQMLIEAGADVNAKNNRGMISSDFKLSFLHSVLVTYRATWTSGITSDTFSFVDFRSVLVLGDTHNSTMATYNVQWTLFFAFIQTCFISVVYFLVALLRRKFPSQDFQFKHLTGEYKPNN